MSARESGLASVARVAPGLRAGARATWALAALTGLIGVGHAVPAAAVDSFQVGVGIHVGQNKNALDATDAALKQGGFTSFRDEVFWHRLETKQGVLEFRPASAISMISLRERASGACARFFILNYGNRFYDGGGLLSSDAGIAAYSRYVRFVVKHFKGRVDQFEVWNEWNIGGGGTADQRKARYGSPQDYARVLRAAYLAVKAENADARVIGGAFAGYDYQWIEAFGRAGGFTTLDGFSAHPYVFAEGKGGTPESAIRHLEDLKALVDRLAPERNVRLYVTEAGWPVDTGPHGVSEQVAAEYLKQFMLLARPRPWIAGIWWYDLFDDGDDASNKEHRFGLISRAGQKKPAFQALIDVRARLSPP